MMMTMVVVEMIKLVMWNTVSGLRSHFFSNCSMNSVYNYDENDYAGVDEDDDEGGKDVCGNDQGGDDSKGGSIKTS